MHILLKSAAPNIEDTFLSMFSNSTSQHKSKRIKGSSTRLHPCKSGQVELIPFLIKLFYTFLLTRFSKREKAALIYFHDRAVAVREI
jgi:hypothetical protein